MTLSKTASAWISGSAKVSVDVMTLMTMYKLLIAITHFRYSTISDADLDAQICVVKEEMLDVGERMINGALRSRNIIVPRWLLWEALDCVDPINVALRWIRRRCYSVPGRNSLWHIGN